MKVIPNKPHFFKPIQPGFKHGVKIPIGFLKYLKGQEKEHVVLRRAGKKWKVKVNGRNLEEGWDKFADDHDLQLGNILVFRHEGNMEFEVVILDSSHCDRKYAEHPQQKEAAAHVIEETSKKFEFKDVRGTSSLHPRGNKTNLDSKRDANQEKPMPSKKSSHKALPNVEACHRCVCTMKSYFLTNCHVRLPCKFARVNNLENRNCNIMVTTQQRSWKFSLHSSSGHTYIAGGWRHFCIANCLEIGDYLMFEMVADGEAPTLKFHDLRGSQSIQPKVKKNNSDSKRISDKVLHSQGQTDLKKIKTSDMASPKSQVPASTSADTDAYPYFISSIKPCTISKSVLYLPLTFVRSNGLMGRHCEMILVDEKRRSWSVQIGTKPTHFAIKSGLSKFIRANNVQVGDTYKFELANNGSKPIAYFYFLTKKKK